MRDEVAGLGADLDAGIEPCGTDARLDGTRVQVLNFQESASRRVSQPCTGCGGDVGPLGRRGRMRVRCRPCRARAGLERSRRRYEQNPRWNSPRPCRFCGSEFQPQQRTDHRRRACYDCGLVPNRRWPCAACGTPCVRRDGKCDACERAARVRPACVCQSCGVTFVPKSSDRFSYCSRDCAFTAAHDRRVGHEAGDAAAHGVLSEFACVACGTWFASAQRRSICWRNCRRDASRKRLWRRLRNVPTVPRDCAECGGAFLAQPDARYVFCSPRCCNRARRRNRQASERQGFRSAICWNDVVRRCRNQCGICGFPILTHAGRDWSASLDHIVPLARGGLHRQDNVQLAHLTCNSIKNNERPGWRERLNERLRTNSPFTHFFPAEMACG